MASMPRLLMPGSLGPLALKNRIVIAPMTTRKADAEGFVTRQRSPTTGRAPRAAWALSPSRWPPPEKVGKHRNFELGIHDDRFLPGLRR